MCKHDSVLSMHCLIYLLGGATIIKLPMSARMLQVCASPNGERLAGTFSERVFFLALGCGMHAHGRGHPD